MILATSDNRISFTTDDGTIYFYDVIKSITGAYTLVSTDDTLLCSGTFTVTLPDSALNKGKVFNIKNISSGLITVACYSSQTIDGLTTQSISQNDNMNIQSNGSNWYIK